MRRLMRRVGAPRCVTHQFVAVLAVLQFVTLIARFHDLVLYAVFDDQPGHPHFTRLAHSVHPPDCLASEGVRLRSASTPEPHPPSTPTVEKRTQMREAKVVAPAARRAAHLALERGVEAGLHEEDVVCLGQVDPDRTGSGREQEHGGRGVVLEIFQRFGSLGSRHVAGQKAPTAAALLPPSLGAAAAALAPRAARGLLLVPALLFL